MPRKRTRNPKNPTLLPAPASDAKIDHLVVGINRLCRRAALEMVLGVGELVVEGFYEGDLDSWRSRGTKDTSFRKLADRTDLQLSAAGLYRSVATYELCMRLGISSWRSVGVSHLYAVLGLDHGDQRWLIAQAEDEAWTVRDLERRAKELRTKTKGKRGRPRLPAFVKTVGKLGRIIDGKGEAFGDLDKVDELSHEDAQRLYRTVTDLRQRCEALQEELRHRLPDTERG